MQDLTLEQLAHLGQAALDNARRLIRDARALEKQGRLPSAYLLAGLAADELGKHVLVISFSAQDQTPAQWAKFWRRFRQHQEKLGDALLMAWIGDPFSDDPPPDIEAFHRRRLSATYIDVKADGRPTTPEVDFQHSDVCSTIDRIDGEITHSEQVFAHLTPAQLAAGLQRAQGEINSLSKYGAMGMAAFAIAARIGLSKEDAVRLAELTSQMLGSDDEDRESSAARPIASSD